jgi:hypothetical protein
MKSNAVTLSLYGDPRNVHSVCGRFTADIETKQRIVYTLIGDTAIITAFEPVVAIRINLALPLKVPVTDLGSGLLTRIDLNCDTLQAQLSICPTAQWANRRHQAPAFPGPRTEAFLTGSLR